MRLSVLILSAGLAVPAALALAPRPAFAQTAAPQVRLLSLAEVLQAARDNPDVVLARQALAAARADVQAADHAPVPVLSAKAASIDLDNGLGGGRLLRDKRIDKGLGIDWTLERGGKRVLRTDAAQRAAQAARSDLQEVGTQQQIAAAAAFYDLLAAQERVQQVGELARAAADLDAAAQRRLRAGDIARQEGLRTAIEARRADAEVRGAQADLQRARLTLAQVTGLAGTVQAREDWPQPLAMPSAFDDIESRPDVQAARERVAAAQSAFDAAQALRRNDVTVGASLDHYPGTSRRLLELRVQMPLGGVLGGYGYEGEIARARAALDQAQAQLDKARLAAGADSARLLEDLRAAQARQGEFREQIVPRAREVAALAELAYAKGALPLFELIDARRTLRAVLIDEIAARADHARAVAAWQLRQSPPTP